MTFGMLTYCQILKIVKPKDEISVFFIVVEFWLLCVNGLWGFFLGGGVRRQSGPQQRDKLRLLKTSLD